MGQKETEQKKGEQCVAAVDVQPTTSKSDRLLGFVFIRNILGGLKKFQELSCV
jgi:hypothetical protein